MKDKIEEKTSCFACCPITKAASQFTMSGVKYKNNKIEYLDYNKSLNNDDVNKRAIS